MAKQKRPARPNKKLTQRSDALPSQAAESRGPDPTDGAEHTTPASADLPTSWQRAITIAIVLHFVTLFVAFSSNLYQSLLQQEAIRYLSPYLVTTSQVYGALPLEWTHAQSYDLPMDFEVRSKGSQRWETLISANRSDQLGDNWRWSNLTRILRMVIMEDPESEIAAELGLKIANHYQSRRNAADLASIRFIQPYTPSFDEATLLAGEDVAELDVSTEPEVIYQADVVYDQSGKAIGLLPILESYRSSKAAAPTP
ncbi:MAG: hypothetical protein NXI32_27220 [bacterium]|nr:hypothetical protein [bacterium]